MLLKEQRTRIAQLESQLQLAQSQAQLAAAGAAPQQSSQPVDTRQIAQLTSDVRRDLGMHVAIFSYLLFAFCL